MNFKELEKFLVAAGEPVFRAKQIRRAIFKDAAVSVDEISVLPAALRAKLSARFSILPFTVKSVLSARDKRSHKALLELKDGSYIESVLLNSKPGFWSACVSSQVGCAMKCAFCATGASGFRRNLSPEEIWGQALFWNNFLKKNGLALRLSSVVYMGMGEPFNNFDNVCESIRILTDNEALGMSERGVSVSTCGVFANIEKFAREFPQVNLALSLHSADEKKRAALMPVSRAYGLAKIAEGLKKYFKTSNRKVFIEYILLAGINDGDDDARQLMDYLGGIGRSALLHVNLIVFNPVRGLDFRPSSAKRARAFKELLIKNGFNATIRKSLGQEIEGACGQLAGSDRIFGS